MVRFNIPTVMTADELMDLAYHRAAKAVKPAGIKSKLASERALAIAKLQSIQDILGSRLKNYVEAFPTIEDLHPYYREMVDILVGVDRLRKSLGALSWAKRKITGVCSATISRLKQENNPGAINRQRSAAYGRVSSVLKQIDQDLVFINSSRDVLRKLPEIDPELPTIVIAGYPNVGKSLLVDRLSSAKPEVAAYPFTTKQVSVGHFEIGRISYQVIDTPGLLDSDPDGKKKIERQAVMSLKHLADLMVFMLDPSEYCGYPLELQLNLLDRLKTALPDLTVIVIENKSDLKTTDSDRQKISALNNHGIDELRTEIINELKEKAQSIKAEQQKKYQESL